MYTSGSTGQPKGVVVTHRNVVRLVTGQTYAEFGPDQVFLQMAPLAFDASTFEIWGALLHGARLVLYPGSSIDLTELRATLERHGVTTLWLTAGLFHQVVDMDVGLLSGLEQLLAGGDELLPDRVSRAMRALPGVKLVNGYGPTEATTFSCCFDATSAVPFDDSVPIGRPIANTSAYVLDRELEPTPVGRSGRALHRRRRRRPWLSEPTRADRRALRPQPVRRGSALPDRRHRPLASRWVSRVPRPSGPTGQGPWLQGGTGRGRGDAHRASRCARCGRGRSGRSSRGPADGRLRRRRPRPRRSRAALASRRESCPPTWCRRRSPGSRASL